MVLHGVVRAALPGIVRRAACMQSAGGLPRTATRRGLPAARSAPSRPRPPAFGMQERSAPPRPRRALPTPMAARAQEAG
eukprot:813468-Prymnesium_polylepis.2